MAISVHNWPRMIRRHIMRLLFAEYVQAASRPALAASGVVVFVGLLSLLVPLVWRTTVIVTVIVVWTSASLIRHYLRWRSIALVRRLDAAYGWQSALTTMVDFAHRDDDIALGQRTHTFTLLHTTPATQLPLPTMYSWLVLIVVSVSVAVLPTPFDTSMRTQQQIRSIAQSTAQSLDTLPTIPEMNLPLLQQQLASASDAQGLLATLTQAQSTLDRAQTAHQAWQQALNQARTTEANQLDAAILERLTGTQRAQLDAAITARQQGDMQPLNDLQAAAQSRSQSLAEWKQALRQSATQTRAQAPNQFAIDQPTTTGQQGTSQQGTGQQGTSQQGTSQQGTGQQGTGQQGTGQQGTSQQGTGQQGTSQQGTGQQGTSQQGTGQQGASGDDAGQQGGGAGAGSGAGDTTVSLFVPGLNQGEMLDISTANDGEGGRDTQTADTAGANAQSTLTYADVVRQASDQANQAIDSAQIPWTSEGIVRDYFRQLQGEQP